MQATSTPFKTMVEGTEQAAAWSVGIALPGGIYPDVSLAVSALHVEATTTTDITQQQRTQAGYDSSSCTFTLSGMVDATDESKTAAWLFSPYSTTSPLYRSDAFAAAVTVKLGLYPAGAGGAPELLTKFTGTVDEYVVNSDGSVEFTCLDRRNEFRSVPELLPVVTEPPYNAGLTSEFVVDHLLRAASGGAVSSWPATRPNCVLAVGFRSSLWAEVGTLVDFVRGTIDMVPGVFGTAFSPIPDGTFFADTHYLNAGQPGDDIYMEFWASNLQLPGGSPPYVLVALDNSASAPVGMRFWVTRNSVNVQVQDGVSTDIYTWAVTAADSHFVAAQVHWPVGGTSWSVTLRCDGATQASGTRTVTFSRRSNALDEGTVELFGSVTPAIEALQVTAESAAVPSYPFTPQAVLDPSLNPLQVVPDIPAGDPYQVIQAIADAELAVAGFDESGIFRFRNRNTLRTATSARDITSSASLADLGIDWSAASVVNRAQIGYTGWEFASTNTTLWAAAKALKVAGNSSRDIPVTLTDNAFNLDTAFSVLPNGTVDATTSRYRASTSKAGITAHPGLTITATQTGATKAVITLTNTYSADAYLVSSADYLDMAPGTPVFYLAGAVLTADDEVTVDVQYPAAENGGAASSRFGEIAYQDSGNQWRQDGDATQQLAQDIVFDSYQPRPDLTGVTIIPDPRLQLMDRVHIVDTHRTGVDEYATIFGLTTDWSPGRYQMSIDARTVTKPGGMILGVTGRSELGSTTWL